MRKYLLLITLITLTVGATWGQSSKSRSNIQPPLTFENEHTSQNQNNVQRGAEDYIRCFTVENEAQRRANDNTIPSKEDFEQWIQNKIEEQKQSGTTQRATYNIPYIVHVIHDNDAVGTGDNISAAKIYAQIQQINDDFQRTNSDAGNTPGVFAGVAGSIDLEFIPAIEDEAGNPLATPGINRINRNTEGWSAPPYGTCTGNPQVFGNTYIENTIKPASSWDPERFFNIWSMDVVCGILGYAQFPSSSGLDGLAATGGDANKDGCVLLASSIGSISNPGATAPYNLGRTATHEIGHWLGLRHTWGDGNCSADDFCNDTPNTGNPNYTGSPCTFPGPNSCTDAGTDLSDMFQNYMDYSEDACMNLFTQNQVSRFEAVLANSPRRVELLSSTTGGEGTGGACLTWTDPTPTTGWIDFNNDFGGAPCDDETGCPFNEITGFQIWASEAYDIGNFAAGGTYTFSMCNGPGAGSWIPEFTVMAPSGAIDAFGAGDGDGCSITFTTSEAGTYLIIINEAGACGTPNEIDNGYPAITCTESNEVLCVPSDCAIGNLVDPTMVSICYFDSTSVDVESVDVPVGGDYRVSFSPAVTNLDPGANVTGFSLTGVAPTLFYFNSDANGVLSFNNFPPMKGEWEIVPFVFDGAAACAIADTFRIVVFLDSLDAQCTGEPVCEAGTVGATEVVSLCPGEEGVFAPTGIEIPDGGTYYIEFNPGPGGSGGVNDPNGFTLPITPPITFDNEYFSEGTPMVGTWYINGSILDDGSNLCSESDSLTVVFLTSVDPPCEIVVEECDPPTGLLVDNITSNSADFSWTGNGGEFSFDVELVDITASGTPTGEPTESDVSNPHGFSGLASNNDYAAYVRGDCDEESVDLILTGVFDGPLSGGHPKGAEIFVINDIADLSIYGIGSANNGGGTDGEEFTFFGSATAGDFIYVAADSAGFRNWFGFDSDFNDGAANINGDDAVELFKDGNVVDIFGEIDVDGTGQPWEHLDGYAYRVDATGPDGSTFVLANWTFSGINVYDGEGSLDNSTSATPFPNGTYASTDRVASDWAGPFNFTTLEEVVVAPANDSCLGAISVTCGADFGSEGATDATDIDAPQGCQTSGAGLWYTFDGDDQAWEITATPIGWDNEVHVYSGDCDNLVCEGSVDNGLTGDAETLTVASVSGTTYYIYVGGWGTSQTSIDSFNLSITCGSVVEAPANDSCQGAVSVTCGADFGSVDAIAATDVDAPQGCSASGAGLWYTFDGDDQVWDITATPIGWDNEVHVYSGDCDNLVCEDFADDGFGGDAESVSISTLTGTTYYIYVGGWGTGQTSIDSFNLSITCSTVVETPANDTCSSAIAVACDADFGSVGATAATDADAPQGCSASGAGLWYTFDGDDQVWDITATPIGWDNEVHVYSGDCDNLVCEDFADDGFGGDAEMVSIETVSGTTYYIYVGGWGTGQTSIDSFNLTITCAPPAVMPMADFTASSTTICLGDDVSFTDASTESPTSWDWNFGDGIGTSTDQNPGYVYTAAGTYSVTLTVTNASGSDDTTFIDYITVQDPPTGFGASASETEIDEGESTDLSMTGTFGGVYNWFDGGGNNIASGPTVTVSPTVTTTYTATCSDGVCTVTADITITVNSVGGEPCEVWINPSSTTGWVDFNTEYGGAPCDDGTGCPFNEIQTFEVWASEAYTVDNFIAGGEYAFSMCNGPGAGSWIPEFTIIAPSGAIDAFGAGDGDGCSISWTASETGTYLIVINESGFCGAGSTNGATDNGFPALTCTSGGLASCAPVEPAPVNDTCGGAIAISCDDDFGSVGATEATDAGAPQGCSASGAGLWYTFEGTDEAWTITATPFGWDNEIHVYSGSCDALACEDFADSGFTDDAESVTVNGLIGTTYYVYVGGWGTSVTDIDSFNLTVTCAEIPDAPVNDSCAGALELTIGDEGTCDGGAGFVSTTTAAANQTFITTCDGSLTGDADLWYTFTATSEAIQFNSLTGLPGIEIFDGVCGALGNTVGCLNNASGSMEGLTIGNDYIALIWTDGQQPIVEFCIEALTLAECEAGTATSTDSIALCPDSLATFTTLGDSIVPDGGEYGIFFEMGPDGGGALGGDFVLLGTNTPFSFNADLNGILSDNAFPEFTGTWYVYGAVYRDPANAFTSLCSQTSEFLTVTFLAAGEGDCAPPPPVPSNDTCGGAIAVECGADFGSEGATEATDADAPQGCSASGAGLWYTFEGDDQTWEITATPFGWDNEIHIYSGTCDDLACETFADAGFTDDAETASVNTETGTTYYVYVGGWGTGQTEIDSFNLSITCTPPLPDPACGTVLYDNGGPSGNYANNSNDTITICPDNVGDVVTLEFTFVDIESSTGGAANGCWDFLSIYNGATTDADVLSGVLCGEESGDGGIPWIPEALLEVGDIFTSTDASGCLTIVFTTDGSVSEGGYAADITCAPAPVCDDPTALTVDNITETSADLGWTSGDDETLWHLEIVDITDGGVFTGIPTVSDLTDTFYLATGLVAGNDYAFYVIADCGTDSSEWVGPENFTTLTPVPENDLCDGAIEVFCDDVIAGSTADATNTDGPDFCGTSLTSAPGVWYSFAGNGQLATFSLCGTAYDSKIGVYSGSCDALDCVVGEDDDFGNCGTDDPQVSFNAELGTTYYVYVSGFSSNAGDYTLSVTCIELPENDNCDGAIAVFCDDVITGTTALATNSDGPSFCGTGLTSAPGLWYTFAGTGDDITASLCGTSYDSKIGVYSGSCGALDCVVGEDDDFTNCGTDDPEVTFPSEVGTDYYIYVTGFSSNSGDFTLALTCEIPSCDTAQIAETITDAVCGNDGAIDIEVTAGSGSFTFEWSNGATTEDISGLAPGDYTVNITDDEDGCPATATFTVGGNDAIEEPVPAAITTNGCDGSGTGATIDVTISGGTPPYTYLWTNGAMTEDLVGLSGDDYTLTVTDDNDCTYTTQTFSIPDSGAIFEVIDAIVVDVDCNGNATGSIDITLGGGVPPYIIRWSNDIHTEDIGGLVAGTYVFFATDQTGCEYLSGEIVVNEPDAISEATAGVVANADCNGAATGSVDITITGGTAPYTYVWTNGSTDEDPTNLAAGTHQATVTDANGCTFITATYVIEAPAAIVQAGAVITNADCNGASTGSVNITVSGGTPGYTFDWSDGSTDEDLTDAPAGSYTVDITDANGCEATVGPFTIGEPTAIMVTALTIMDAECNGDATGSINISVAGGTAPYTYSWDNGATTQDLVGVAAGDYVGTITDANGCVLVSPTLTVGEPDAISVSSLIIEDADCNGASTGLIDIEVVGGTAPYTYSWDNGATTQDLVDVPAGDYVGTITDANGCVLVSPTLTVNEPTAIQITSVDLTPVSCNGGNDGAIDIEVDGGTPPYIYNWSNGETTQDLTDLEAGDYTGTITDDNGCVLTATVTIVEPSALFEALPPAVTNVTCNGDTDGAITATIQGGTLPYTITWSNSETGATISDLAPGIYTYSVVDDNGCTFDSEDIEVGEPDVITITGSTTDIACFGETTGTVSITVEGGTGAYSYAWSNGATSANLSGLDAGDYTVTVTDANGCTATSEAFTVTAPASELSASVEVTDATGNGVADGSATATGTGGDGPYSYAWQGGFGLGATITGLEGGIYCVDVTDANGCVVTACGTVGFPTAIRDVLEISEITLYPNPTANVTNLNVRLSKAADMQFAVVDVLGKTYQEQSLTNVEEAEIQFDMTNFAGGTYFIRISVDKEVLSLPVIVQH